MKTSGTFLLFILAVMVSARVVRADDQCYVCHSGLGDEPSQKFVVDIHFKKGISCAACHGGDSKSDDMDIAMAKKNGYAGVPKGDAISTKCAECHSSAETMKKYGSSLKTDQWDELQKSVHAKVSFTGKEHIAQCTTCHGSHGIVSVRNPASPVYPSNVTRLCSQCHSSAAFMRAYNPALPVDQMEKYKTSVHGMKHAKGDIKVAECASCHGSHGIRSVNDTRSTIYPANLPMTCAKCHSDAAYLKNYKIPTDQFEKFKLSVHGIALLEKKDLSAPACNDCHGNHGATPPGVQSISKVCGTCHALNAELFSASPHKKAFDEQKLPECETCHSNHDIRHATDELVGTSGSAICIKCHSESKNTKGFAVAKTMRALIDSLQSQQKIAELLITDAEQKGMEVSEAKFKLRDAHQARLQSRTMVHSFNEKQFREIVSTGITVAGFVQGEARNSIDEYYFRRKGLGIATVIITILVISLYLYIRRVETE
ncbi:MAG: cytochrome c3 family protein [Ignavibacteriales bacterium]|nr:cytochrome c3 family protein [Ignavibacteriales bacterium]